MSFDPRFSRRQMLSAAGLGGASCLFPSLLGARVAEAASVAPKRLLILMTAEGSVYDKWKMRPGGQTDKGDWEFSLTNTAQSSFNPVLSELYNHRQRLLVLDGVDMITEPGDRSVTDGHQAGESMGLTGAFLGGGDVRAGGISVDQIVAKRIAASGQRKSLEIGNSTYGFRFTGPGQKVPGLDSVGDVFKTLFPGGSSPSTPTVDPKVAALAAAQKNVLDTAQAQFRAMANRMGKADQARLVQHADFMSDLYKQVGSPPAAISCDKPSQPSEGDTSLATFDSYSTLLTAALKCDLTRVASIYFDIDNTEGGIGADVDAHQEYWHDSPNGPDGQSHWDGSNNKHSDSTDRTGQLNQAAAKRVNMMYDKLAAVTDVDGRTLLDNTLVVWLYTMGDGGHNPYYYSVVLSDASYFRGGRYLHYDRTSPTPPNGNNFSPSMVAQPHNRVLVSIAQAMGLSDVNQVGVGSINGIDATGPLARLV